MAHEHILVVDDEQKVLKSIVDILRDEGYRVSGVEDGNEADRKSTRLNSSHER